MSYVALYRKFRPNEFEDVKGQKHIITALRNQIKSNRVGHAYLFSGTRGTGKTTVAKILAKAVNCQNPVDGSPCNECSMCNNINSQTSLNVVEIDAASNNGVDNIRQIVEEVQYSPTEGKYKVYIIDEVHMLSTGAFNALLKTLEEPPGYVIFILATTEPHKIPVTILSRCQRYEFKRMQVSTIIERLNELMQKENIQAEENAVKYIAKCADGAMRDALSLLDQCISFYFGEVLTYDKVLEVLGAVDNDIFMKMFGYIVNGQISDGIKLIDSVILDGKDLSQFVINFTWFMRNVMLAKTSDNTRDIIDMTEEKLIELKKMSVEVDIDTLMRYIRIFSELSNQLRYATQKRVLLEAAFIKLCKPQMDNDYEAFSNRIDIIEKKIEKGVITSVSDVNIHSNGEESVTNDIEDDNDIDNYLNSMSDVQKKELISALPDDIKEIARNWDKVIEKAPFSMRLSLKNGIPCAGNDNTLIISFDDDFSYSRMSTEMNITEITNIIISILNKNVVVRTQLRTKGNVSSEGLVDISKLIKAEVTFVD